MHACYTIVTFWYLYVRWYLEYYGNSRCTVFLDEHGSGLSFHLGLDLTECVAPSVPFGFEFTDGVFTAHSANVASTAIFDLSRDKYPRQYLTDLPFGHLSVYAPNVEVWVLFA